jgi:hypothetical protein
VLLSVPRLRVFPFVLRLWVLLPPCRCAATKPCSEFYKSKMTADGLQGYCRECYKITAAHARVKKLQEEPQSDPSTVDDVIDVECIGWVVPLALCITSLFPVSCCFWLFSLAFLPLFFIMVELKHIQSTLKH